MSDSLWDDLSTLKINAECQISITNIVLAYKVNSQGQNIRII